MRAGILSDQGAFYADAQPTKFRAGLFHICTGSYDFPAAHVTAKGAFTNKAPGGVAYRCSFRVTEARFLIERLMDKAAHELGVDPAELRAKNFIKPEQFPWLSPTGFVYDSGDYHGGAGPGDESVGYDALAGQAGRAQRGERPRRGPHPIGIGIASFTEVVGAGPSKDYDIAGIKMFDSAELRVHPTGKAILKLGVQTQGQGHETTFAQIVAEELGIPVADIKVHGGRHRQHALRPRHLRLAARRRSAARPRRWWPASSREKAKLIAAHLLEASPRRPRLRARQVHRARHRPVGVDPGRRLRRLHEPPEGMEAGLEGVTYYDPPNMTYPFGSYIVVVEVDTGDGDVEGARHGRASTTAASGSTR